MVTALYVIMFLCILVVTALRVVWLFSRKEGTQVTEERILDIKEPVLSFVKCFKNNPKRFIAESNERCVPVQLDKVIDYTKYIDYKITDKLTQRVFEATRTVNTEHCTNYISDYPDYVSPDEIRYIFDEISSFYHSRASRLHFLTEIRKKWRAQKEREQLMKDYCE